MTKLCSRRRKLSARRRDDSGRCGVRSKFYVYVNRIFEIYVLLWGQEQKDIILWRFDVKGLRIVGRFSQTKYVYENVNFVIKRATNEITSSTCLYCCSFKLANLFWYNEETEHVNKVIGSFRHAHRLNQIESNEIKLLLLEQFSAHHHYIAVSYTAVAQ